MNQVYDITCDEQVVGKAEVKKEGLYYHFQCKCNLQKTDFYKITVSCNEIERNLGVCVPMDGCLGLDTKVPAKHIGEGTLVFQVVSKLSKVQDLFCPVNPDEPFVNLAQLENAYFCLLDNKPGIRMKRPKEKIPNQPDSDRNQEYRNK